MMAARAIVAALRPPMLAALLLVAGALSSFEAAGKESAVVAPLAGNIRIEDHFSGDELALAKAAAGNDASKVQQLVQDQHADPNAVSSKGLALIAWPVLKDAPDGVAALLDNGADPNRELSGVGPAIVLAAKSADPTILRTFLDRKGDANAVSVNHEPLTIVAQMAGRWANVQLLVERGADINAFAHGNKGDTLISFYSAGQFDKTEWLLQHGADPAARIEAAAKPERVGAQPAVENIYWWPVDTMRFAALAQAQRRCQDFLATKLKIYSPAEPAHLARLRESQHGASAQPAANLDTSISDAEARVRSQLKD